MLHAVIMAGGSGTRFWPESRAARPKQMLNLTGPKTMIQTTVDRLGDLVPSENVLVATTAGLAEGIAEQLPGLPADAILVEPCRRNTAPCIGLAAVQVAARDPEATMVVMPADHVIEDEASFRRAVRFAAELIEAHPERLVTFGIRPSYPAESFGYIERGEVVQSADGMSACQVKAFHEKPAAEVARRYLEAGTFSWNAGIFVWKAKSILASIARFEPKIHAHLQCIADAVQAPDYDEVLGREFAAVQNISIDHAVMERTAEAVVIEAPFDWDDLGSWRAMARLRGEDDQGNTVLARHLGLQTTGTIVRGGDPDHLVVTLGVDDLIVVHTPDATLVAAKDREESIRQLVAMMEEGGLEKYL